MTEDYVNSKIKQAMTATASDKRDAQKLLISWAVRDLPLLLGLTKPHLKAIVAARIDHAFRPAKKVNGAGKDLKFSKEEIEEMVASRPLGDKRSPAVPPPKTSQRQATVMHQLAAAFKKRKKSTF